MSKKDEAVDLPESEDHADTEQESPETEVDLVLEAFDEAVSADAGEDDIKMAMIGAGATFKNVTRLYNKYMIGAGLAISKEEKDEVVSEILEDTDVSSEESFGEAVASIMEKVVSATEKSAAALVRAYAKSKEMEYFVKPKGTGEARVGFASKFYDALVSNASMSEANCLAYLQTAEGTSPNVMKNVPHYQAIRHLANRIQEKKDETAAAA